MAFDNTFKFYLRGGNYYGYYHIENGSVKIQSDPIELKHSIANWEETQLIFNRVAKYHSVMREYSIPITFVQDAARILSHLYFMDGVNAKCDLEIHILHTTTYQYRPWYTGTLDMGNIRIDKNRVEANIMEAGLYSILAARENIVQEIDIDSHPQVEEVRLPGFKVKSTALWQLGFSDATYTGEGNWRNNFPTNTEITTFATAITSNQIAPWVIQHNQTQFRGGTISGLFGDNEYLAKVPMGLFNVSVKGQVSVGIRLNNAANHVVEFRLLVGKPIAGGSGTTLARYSLGLQNVAGLGRQTISVKLDREIAEIPAGTVLYLMMYISPLSSGSTAIAEYTINIDGSDLLLTYMGSNTSTQTNGLRFFDFAKSVVRSMTGNRYGFVSDFLSNPAMLRTSNWDNIPWHTIVTSGDAIRRIPGSKLKTSFADLYKQCFATWGLAASIDGNNIRMEPLSYYFSSNELFRVDKVNDVSIYPAREYIFNAINVGYGKYDNENIVGKNEFNTGMTFMLDHMTRIRTQEDAVAPYRADIYGIEETRSRTSSEIQKDTNFDDSIFMIECDPDPIQFGLLVPYKGYTNVSGVDDPDGVYNITLSPKRALLRHLKHIRSWETRGMLRFQTTDKNPELVANAGVGVITETEDIDLSSNYHLGRNVSPLFAPYIFEFEGVPPIDLGEIMDAKKGRGYITFEYKGVTLYGYPLEIGVKPATRASYTFKLLSHPANDLTQLM